MNGDPQPPKGGAKEEMQKRKAVHEMNCFSF